MPSSGSRICSWCGVSFKSDGAVRIKLLMGGGSTDSMAEWQGSVDACWRHYVDPFRRPESDRMSKSYRRGYGYDKCGWVYLVGCRIGKHVYLKVGVAKDMKNRLAGLMQSIPFADWMHIRSTWVADPEQRETDMLVACAEFWSRGEWICPQPSKYGFELPDQLDFGSSQFVTTEDGITNEVTIKWKGRRSSVLR